MSKFTGFYGLRNLTAYKTHVFLRRTEISGRQIKKKQRTNIKRDEIYMKNIIKDNILTGFIAF